MTPAEFKALHGAKPSKYRNRPIVVDGVRFDSQAEARRHGELTLMQRAGEISDLARQVPFDLQVNGHHIARYVADHVYTKDGERVVEDTKGVATPVYKIKRSLMAALHGVKIVEVRR